MAIDAHVCAGCGNCTAVCGLSGQGANFPRRFIRYIQLGLADDRARRATGVGGHVAALLPQRHRRHPPLPGAVLRLLDLLAKK